MKKNTNQTHPGVSKSEVFCHSQFCTVLNGTEQIKNPTVFRYSPPTSCHAACGTLSPSVSVVQQQCFTEQRVCVGLHVASGLLKINLRCVARGCLGDASEREETGWK